MAQYKAELKLGLTKTTINNARQLSPIFVDTIARKNMKGLVGGPLLVGGLGSRPYASVPS